MNRALAVLAVFALFVAGIAVGALGTHLYYDRQLGRPGGPPRMGRRFFERRLHRELDLTRDQQRTIDAILERSRKEADALRHDMSPRIHAIMDRAHEEIEAVLTPEQAKRFQDLLERHRRRAEQFLLGPPGGRRRKPGRGWEGPRDRPADWPPDGPPPPPEEGSPPGPPAEAGEGSAPGNPPPR